MGLFSKLFKATSKIDVQFINDTDGSLVGNAKLDLEQLPDTFELDTTLHIAETEWSVKHAFPVLKADFSKTKQLEIRLVKIEYVDPESLLFTIPSISHELPKIVNHAPFSDFEVTITEDDWRQKEYLNTSAIGEIHLELNEIKSVQLANSTQVGNDRLGFTKCHVRKNIGPPDLKINLAELMSLLGTEKIGSLKLAMNNTFIENGFAL